MLNTIFAFVIALGLIITFHEFGHYYAARKFGVHVERFSIGFGRIILKRNDKNGTEWALSAIPLGGYVKMQGQGLNNIDANTATSFANKPLWQRSVIVAAGPLANFILAILLYMGLSLWGTYEPEAILAKPEVGTPAQEAGISGNETVTSVDGKPIQSWTQFRWMLLDKTTTGGVVNLTTKSDSSNREYQLYLPELDVEPDGPDPLMLNGLTIAVPKPTIKETMADSPAQQAGLLPGDIVQAINDSEIDTATELIHEISLNVDKPIILEVLRNDSLLKIAITPRANIDDRGNSKGQIGAILSTEMPMVLIRHGLFDSALISIEKTVSTAWLSLKMLGRMVTGKVSVRNISGPVTIDDYAGRTASAGLVSYIGFLALISISIGVLNLLPVPMLDGGHLFLYAIEAIRKKPLSDSFIEQSHRIGLALLGTLMILALFNDLTRLFT